MLQATETVVVTVENIVSLTGVPLSATDLSTVYKIVADALSVFPGARILAATLTLQVQPPPPPPLPG